jgi:hypothetical protein
VKTVGSADDPRRLPPDAPYLLARTLTPALGGTWVWREMARGSPRELQAVAHALEQDDAVEVGFSVLAPLVLKALFGLQSELRVLVSALPTSARTLSISRARNLGSERV